MSVNPARGFSMTIKLFAAAAAALCFAVPASAQNVPWHGYAGNMQHTARAPAAAQSLTKVHWKMAVDAAPPGFLGIHYASPMITAGNMLLVPVKLDDNGTYQMEARNGATGALIWKEKVSYVFPPHNWTPSIPAHLSEKNRLFFAGPGGTIYYRDQPSTSSNGHGVFVFYGARAYAKNKGAYNGSVMVSTPITADAAGNIYFGYTVSGSPLNGLESGIARISADGKGSWISAGDAAQDSSMSQVPTNCAPTISADGKTVYIAASNGSAGYLLGLDSTTLQPKYRASLIDPNSGTSADIDNDSSASPTIGPDGDVYYGVLEYDVTSHNDRGWLLHFDAALATEKTPGSFGWDDTVSVVPASMVPSYSGPSSYLLMSKYNNYADIGTGDGRNKIAILDPKGTEPDPIIPSVTVMKEVLTKLGPHRNKADGKGAVYEWCINSAVVDVADNAVMVNSEDGHTYRWDLPSNTLTQTVNLNQPRVEAYTPTLIGPDGTVYAINNAHLYALGN
jgi:hypothetical protein